MRSHQVDGQLDLETVNAAVKLFIIISLRKDLMSSQQDFKIRPLTLNDFLVGEQLGGRLPEAEQLD